MLSGFMIGVRKWLKDKRGNFVQENLGWLLIALAVLVVGIMSVVILKGKGMGALNYVKNLFRFGPNA